MYSLKVKFGSFSTTDCCSKFQEILSKQRRYRILSEVLNDAKEWIKRPWSDFNKPKLVGYEIKIIKISATLFGFTIFLHYSFLY